MILSSIPNATTFLLGLIFTSLERDPFWLTLSARGVKISWCNSVGSRSTSTVVIILGIIYAWNHCLLSFTIPNYSI